MDDLPINQKMIIIRNLSRRDLAFHDKCVQLHNFSPFVGPFGLSTRQHPRRPAFRVGSRAYDEFVQLVKAKDWLKKGRMPPTREDPELISFMEKFGFGRTQVHNSKPWSIVVPL